MTFIRVKKIAGLYLHLGPGCNRILVYMGYDRAMTVIKAREKDILSVSRLNREVKALLEGSFSLLWVEGEISNLARPSSGHIYFSLKDARAQVRCAMFRSRNNLLDFKPENGQQVLIRARVSLYEGRGEFQLLAESIQPAGDGRLRLAFEQLKQRLAEEGLFELQHKQALPEFPTRIGVITSPSGAAIRDIISVLKRRFPSIPVIIYPVPVQGAGASDRIAHMLYVADQRRECDVLILSRGGGSLEDLWSFNEESVARAIHACSIPLVSGIGHEIDFTIADFVADQRAPTPSAAAELISPDRQAIQDTLDTLKYRISANLLGLLQSHRQNLTWLSRRLLHPGRRLQELAQRTDDLNLRLIRAAQAQLRTRQHRLENLSTRLSVKNPVLRLTALHHQWQQLAIRLQQASRQQLRRKQEQLQSAMRMLDTVSPLATLDRGYAIVTRQSDGHVITAAQQLHTGEIVSTRFANGRANCRVEEIEE